MNDRPLTEQQQYWLSHIKTCQQQGLSMKRYAQREGIALNTLYQAKCRMTKAKILPGKKPSIFQRVVVRTVPAVSTDCTITLPNGIRLDWIASSDAQSLALLGAIVDQLNSK